MPISIHCKSQAWLGHQSNLVGSDYGDGERSEAEKKERGRER